MATIGAFLFWFIAFFLPFDSIVSVYAYTRHFGGPVYCFTTPMALTGILAALRFWQNWHTHESELSCAMEINPASPPVVKEFRFYPESEMVTVVFGDDKSEDFTGTENFRKARIAARASVALSANLELVDNRGGSVIMIVPEGTPHETFDL